MTISDIISTTTVDEAAEHYGLGRGRVRAGDLTFEYLEAGTGPLALCLHGFPDSPFTFRHLLPELADAGFHAVAPFIRGFAPTEMPPLRTWVHTSVMVADQIALAQALGGGPDALLVAHDWNAVAAWGTLGRAPDAFGRAVVINIPPFDIFAENLGTYEQIKRSFYFWYFQMQSVIEDRIRQDDFRFIQDIWGDWSPGYEADEDMVHIRRALADPDHLHAALGYYWGQFDPGRFGSPQWAAQQEAAWGGSVTQPVLYLHGTNDGCHGMTPEQTAAVPAYAGPGSAAELIEGVGHFMLVEKPAEINKRITDWLGRTGGGR